MSIQSILLPVFVQVGLIFALCLGMIASRNLPTSRAADPARGKLLSDSFSNQFEIPLLFFALIPLAILIRKADFLFVVMEWLFVLSRLVHAAVHTTSNSQPARGILWFAGVVVLLLMWLIFAFRVLFPPVLAPL